jgi:site-specific DNA recombinase
MKNAVIYQRVSTDEQKEHGFSLHDQESRLKKHCAQKGYNIIKQYSEDFSAKDFNRPAFKEFLNDLKNKRIKPDIFLVVRMDRFSRDMFKSLSMINDFQNWGIGLECIENHIIIDTPEAMIPFVLNLVLPEVDNKRRGLNTKRGMRQALKEGRWMWKAPVGYRNDKANRVVVPNDETANLVQWAFETYSEGLFNANEVWRQVSLKGLKISKQRFYDMLIDPFYIGKITINAYEDEPEITVDGIHQPLIAEDVFHRSKAIFLGKKKPYKTEVPSDELVLKGHLVCPDCNKRMTGSRSKGNGGRYHYYHCQRKYGCHNSIPANEANLVFSRYMQSFTVSDEVLPLFHKIIDDVFDSDSTDKMNEKQKIDKELENLESKIDSLNNKFLDDVVSPSDYKELKYKIEHRKTEVLSKKAAFGFVNKELKEYKLNALALATDLGQFYMKATPEAKSKLIGSIFPENLIYDRKIYRTTKINEALQLILNLGAGLKENSPEVNSRLSSVAPPAGLEPATL